MLTIQTLRSDLERCWTPLALAFGSDQCHPSLKQGRMQQSSQATPLWKEVEKGGCEGKETNLMQL